MKNIFNKDQYVMEDFMSTIIKTTKEKNVLIMMSGGRDSFLSVCKMIALGYHVHLITYDNGCMSGTDNVNILIKRIIERFGTDKVSNAGIHSIAQNVKPLLKTLLYEEPTSICSKYPHLIFNQLICLACHSTMYLHSIAYCRANNITAIAEGAREQQGFFVELPEMREQYTSLCQKYEIELHMPVYNLSSDMDRKNELAEWEFLPKSYEPQCWLGCPLLKALTTDQRKDLELYYEKEMRPLFDSMIDRLIIKKKFIKQNETRNYI